MKPLKKKKSVFDYSEKKNTITQITPVSKEIDISDDNQNCKDNMYATPQMTSD